LRVAEAAERDTLAAIREKVSTGTKFAA